MSFLDPFRDGKSNLRISEYINDLMLGPNLGLTNNEVIKFANNKYKKKWGKDKVISNE